MAHASASCVLASMVICCHRRSSAREKEFFAWQNKATQLARHAHACGSLTHDHEIARYRSAWQERSRSAHSRPSRSKSMWSVIALAGCCFLHATFALGQDSWTQGFPSQAPSGRNFHAMVYDADRNEVVLFGGIVNNSQVLGDTGSGMAPTGFRRRRRPARRLGTDTRWRTTQRAGKWCCLEDSWQAVQATLTPGCGTGQPGRRCFPPPPSVAGFGRHDLRFGAERNDLVRRTVSGEREWSRQHA